MIVSVEGVRISVPDDATPDEIDEIAKAKAQPPPTGVPMASAANAGWDPTKQYASGNPDLTVQNRQMDENRRSGWDVAKTVLNAAAFGQRPRIRAAMAAVLPSALRSEEDVAALGRGGYGEAKAYFDRDQAAAAGSIPAIPRALAGLSGSVTTLPALMRVAGRPVYEATAGMGPGAGRALLRALGGTGEAAAVNAGLSAAAAPEGQAWEQAKEAGSSPVNLLGAIPGVAELVKNVSAPWLAGRAADRAVQTLRPGMENVDEFRRFDPSGEHGVRPGMRAVGEIVRDSPVLKAGMNASEIDVALKKHLDVLGARKGELVKAAEAAGAHPDYGPLKAEFDAIRAELNTDAVKAAFGKELANDYNKIVRRIEALYAPTPSKPLGVTAGSGAQPVGTRLNPGASPYANEKGLIPPNKQTLTPIKDIPEPSAAPHSMADMEEGLPASRTPEAEAYVETFTPGHEFGKERVQWTDPQNRQSFSAWEDLKSSIQKLIDNTKAGFPTGTPESAMPGIGALRKLSGTINAANEAAFAAKLPDQLPAFLEAKRQYGAIMEAAKAGAKAATRASVPAEQWSKEWLAHRMGYALPAAMGVGAATAGHGGVPAVLAAVGGAALAGGAHAFGKAGATRTRVLDALSKGAAAIPQAGSEAEALMKYLRGEH